MREPFKALYKSAPPRPDGFRGLRRSSAVLFMLAAAVFTSGCLVDNDKYDEARQHQDKIRTELQELYRSNDVLNQEITRLYNDSETLSTQLAMSASLVLHDRYTTGLTRPPATTPAPSRSGSTAVGRTRPGAAQPSAGSQARPATTQQRPAAASPRDASTSGRSSMTSTPALPPSTPPTTQPTPPPATPRPRPSGSVDWGSL